MVFSFGLLDSVSDFLFGELGFLFEFLCEFLGLGLRVHCHIWKFWKDL